MWPGLAQATTVLPTAAAVREKHCWAEMASSEFAPALWPARSWGAFESPPLLATATSLVLRNSCAREGEACAGVGKAFLSPGRQGREKWTVLSWKVIPSLLWSEKLQACFCCWEAHSSPQPFLKGLVILYDSHQPQCWPCRELPPFCTAVAPYEAPNEKPKLPCAQPERNWKNSLSCLFVPSPFPTLRKLSSIIDRSMLPPFIDCTPLLIPNCCFHFFTEPGWPFRLLCHLSWHWNHRVLVI